MSRDRIGGPLGLAQYAALASMHRPTDPAELSAEIRRLHRGGLTAQDVSVALRLSLDYVVNILGEPHG